MTGRRTGTGKRRAAIGSSPFGCRTTDMSQGHAPSFVNGLRALALAMPLLAPLAAAGQHEVATVTERLPRNLYWGDTHLHSNLSPDAAAGGNRSFGLDQAYRVARGGTVTAHNGLPARLNRPLDFLLVADHAEYLGLFPGLEAADPALMASETGRRWRAMLEAGPDQAANIMVEYGNGLRNRIDLLGSTAFTQSVWQTVVDTAEAWNEPGVFTAFIGYEWSSGRGGGNMHRVVLFRDGAERVREILPFSSFDGDRPRDLWRAMRNFEETTGGRVLAIPHNSNVSAGLMFAMTDSDGQAMTPEYARERVLREPLLEVTQFKGDSETHPFVSPTDEFADFESWDRFAGWSVAPHQDSMFAGEYARPALRNGLALAAQLGVNPFKFGMLGSTDSHTGIASGDEDNFWGKFSWHEPSATRALEPFVNIPDIPQKEWEMAAGGYAAVWATANTRAALFDAMARREVYATTGPRITVRLFGGWNFEPADLARQDWVAHGYANGVPMGGELGPAQDGRAPSFIISALKDPRGANLDRVQVIKGWLDAGGATHERIYDVALSDGRSAADGRPVPVGNTVDLATATWQDSIGAATLQVVWWDPHFDAAQPAFWYVRVIEVPTPRWTAYDAVRFGTPMPAEVPMTLQERAYTSPVWYTP